VKIRAFQEQQIEGRHSGQCYRYCTTWSPLMSGGQTAARLLLQLTGDRTERRLELRAQAIHNGYDGDRDTSGNQAIAVAALSPLKNARTIDSKG
jgi:hypothetical protein